MSFTPAPTASVAAFLGVVAFVVLALPAGTAAAARRLRQEVRPWLGKVLVLEVVWLAVTSAIPLSGALSGDAFPAYPMTFGLFLLGAVALAFSPVGTVLARGSTLTALVGFHVFRLPLELVLHAWFVAGTIPETMTWTGQNVDIITGVAAVLMAPFAGRSVAIAWSFTLIGFGLLLNVLRVAILSTPLPFAWEGVDPPLTLVAHMPYSLIGSVCVAGALAGHLILIRALLARRGAPG